MRLAPDEHVFLKKTIFQYLPEAKIYLFGSRVSDVRKGGDIDILVLGNRKLSFSEKTGIHYAFEHRFGEQKLDLVSMTDQDQHAFKTSILNGAVLL